MTPSANDTTPFFDAEERVLPSQQDRTPSASEKAGQNDVGHEPSAATGSEASFDFEAALNQLEAIVTQLESGKLPLEAAIARYEAGVRLVQRCRQALQAAEERLIAIEALQQRSGQEGIAG